jgi:hypothetical protein
MTLLMPKGRPNWTATHFWAFGLASLFGLRSWGRLTLTGACLPDGRALDSTKKTNANTYDIRKDLQILETVVI